MVRDRILALLDSVKRRVTCMSEQSLREEFESKDKVQFRSFWSPSIYTMTIERYEIPNDEIKTS